MQSVLHNVDYDTFHELLWETENEVDYTNDSEESTEYYVVIRRRVKCYNIKPEAVKKIQSFPQREGDSMMLTPPPTLKEVMERIKRRKIVYRTLSLKIRKIKISSIEDIEKMH